MLARIATLEEQVKTLYKQLDHLDICLDSVKRTIWAATGALGVIVFLIGLYFRK